MSDLATHEAVARSVFDRAAATARDAEQLWPHNALVLGDPLIEARFPDALVGPDAHSAWGERAKPDVLTILWPANGTAHPVGWGEDIATLAARTYPLDRGQFATCDRCELSGPIYGAALLVSGCKVVGLVCCGTCAHHLTTAGYRPTWTHPTPTKEK